MADGGAIEARVPDEFECNVVLLEMIVLLVEIGFQVLVKSLCNVPEDGLQLEVTSEHKLALRLLGTGV